MHKLRYETIPVTPVGQNARIIWPEGEFEAVFVDPGGDAPLLIDRMKALALKPVAIWLTHPHFDHCGAVAPLMRKYEIPLYGHIDGKVFRTNIVNRVGSFGFNPDEFENCPEPTNPTDESTKLALGTLDFRVIYAPGHCPGHLCFYQPDNGVLLSGDTLMAGSIGRTDMPGGDHDLLIKNIKEKLLVLPDETLVLSGHGPETTIGQEKRTNPFVGG